MGPIQNAFSPWFERRQSHRNEYILSYYESGHAGSGCRSHWLIDLQLPKVGGKPALNQPGTRFTSTGLGTRYWAGVYLPHMGKGRRTARGCDSWWKYHCLQYERWIRYFGSRSTFWPAYRQRCCLQSRSSLRWRGWHDLALWGNSVRNANLSTIARSDLLRGSWAAQTSLDRSGKHHTDGDECDRRCTFLYRPK